MRALTYRTVWCCVSRTLVFVLGAILAGCPLMPTNRDIANPKPVRVNHQDEAATVLVSATMVAPWAQVSAAMKPNFTLTGDTAVSAVIPTTELIQSQVLTALGFSLGVGLPGSSTQATTTTSSSAATTSSATTTKSPGVAPSPPTGAPAGAQLPTASSLPAGLSLDPLLKYKAAYYLNQEEVQLLNQEIDNAAVRECFEPYVVKLKLAVMTYRPHLAYSVHTRVAFVPQQSPTLDEIYRAAEVVKAEPYILFGSPLPADKKSELFERFGEAKRDA